ncbi:ALG11 [[Candida] subhashii]|uniref:GDP-Man:Man(3)GlcNAc(2)-PP-Dol alpha-1,2-mannosyltransferase n=1 Tax=[Candida] subhashii TaxID=561895 RepID=A0A8J5ULY4_9ASCO|nr:ALG11 [[Candida] subhashii]KAG7663001.1 ALG11 [[Candida] subhashii]
MWLIISVILVVLIIRQLISRIIPKFLLVSHKNLTDQINNNDISNIKHRKSSTRRQLILTSENPSYYTNYLSNKITINPNDKQTPRFDESFPNKTIHGFFHPYANNGGGGERVLWQAVKATLLARSENIVVIYTTNIESSPEEILRKAGDKFQISDMDSTRIVFLYLKRFANLIDGNYWKRFTLVGQLLGSVLLAGEALFALSPDVWIDTMGLPGSYLIMALLFKGPILAYNHYPIIQNDMFNKLKFKKFDDLNKLRLSVRDFFELGKFIYWSILYYFYVYLGSMVDIGLANGTWTFNHLQDIWYLNSALGHKLEILYPPCGTEFLTTNTDPTVPRENKLLYLAQFRPEKRHSLILKEYQEFLSSNFPNVSKPTEQIPTIVFAGSCRTKDDTATLNNLKDEVSKLKLDNFVEFAIDISYDEVVSWLSRCKFGLNAMWNEHFGIGVVEYMARGAIPIVHASAGPLMDIVTGSQTIDWHNDSGFFFKSMDDPDLDPSIQDKEETEGYINFEIVKGDQIVKFPTFKTLLTELYVNNTESISEDRLNKMRLNGQEVVKQKFSNKVFTEKWIEYMNEIQELYTIYREERNM